MYKQMLDISSFRDRMVEVALDQGPPVLRRQSLMALRRALLMLLAAIEDYLELPRSVPPKRERQAK